MSEHTKTPWEIESRRDQCEEYYSVLMPIGLTIPDNIGDDDALFIVRAVNNHEKLVKALEAAIAALEDPRNGEWPYVENGHMYEHFAEVSKAAKEALAEARK